MPNIIHWIGSFFLLAAMALLIVASVSSPIWDSQGYLKGTINGQSFTAGNWGWVVGATKSASKMGYDNAAFNSAAGISTSMIIFKSWLTKALIVTPIAAGIAFIALLFTFSTHLVMGIVAMLFAMLAFITAIAALGFQLGLFILARRRINALPNSSAHFGTMLWLTVAACGCLLIASITVCFTRKSNKRRAEDREFASVPAMRDTSTVHTAPASVVGSTHPMMHDTNTYNNTMANDGYTGSNTYHTPGTGAHTFVETPIADTSAAQSSTHGHQWTANNNERY